MAIGDAGLLKITEAAADGVVGTSGAATELVTAYTQGGAVVLYDGTSTGGTKILTLADGDSVHFGDKGVLCEDGLYVDWTAGTFMVAYRQ